MEQKKPLPVYGVGPLYVYGILLLTAAAIWLNCLGYLPRAGVNWLDLPLTILGICLILSGILLWIQGALASKLAAHIRQNQLVTSGVYSWVRNPIYAAFLFACTGALCMAHNLWLLLLPLVYWAFLTLLMKHTEEKWLAARFGEAYKQYCQRTNRCIPWFPKTKRRT